VAIPDDSHDPELSPPPRARPPSTNSAPPAIRPAPPAARPTPPPRPRDIIIERWVPYGPQAKRRT
ncbi:unnamed protein product, partial [Rotaria sp. Silwood1]